MKKYCLQILFFISFFAIPSYAQQENQVRNTSDTTYVNTDSTQLTKVIYSLERSGMPNGQHDNGIKIYPNPTDGDLNIDYEFASGTELIEVMDLLGIKIFEMRFQKSFNISHLNRGIYFIRLLDQHGRLIVMERVIKK